MSVPLQTPLTQEHPTMTNLTRHDLEALLGDWHPSRADAAWYRTEQAAVAGSKEGSIASASVAGPPMREEAFEAFVESLPHVKALRAESQRLLQQSEEKAARNVAVQPALEALRAETQQLYDRARALEQHWPSVEQEMHDAYRRFTPSALLFTLTQSASKLHDESESLASAFVEGLPLEVASAARGLTPPDSGTATPTGRDADGDATFVRRYRALRTTYHRRNLMADRWARGTITWRDD